MTIVELGIIAKRKDFQGKIEWDSLIYLYNEGYPEYVAIQKYLKARENINQQTL